MASPRQLEMWPLHKRTAKERRERIRERLQGLEYRQAARAARRRRSLERRRSPNVQPSAWRQTPMF